MQVELAQLRYRLPRLRGRGMQLQPAGRRGIGTRGPGETQLEVDRRRILRRDHQARDATSPARPAPATTQRKARRRRELPHGRARRLHQRRQVDAAQPPHRRRRAGRGPALLHARPHRPAGSRLPGGETVLLSDTVGFVRRLPHQLVESFRSTLEEVVERRPARPRGRRAPRPTPTRQIEAVRSVLREIDAGDVPELLGGQQVRRRPTPRRCARCSMRIPGRWPSSAVTGAGVDELLRRHRRPAARPRRRGRAARALRPGRRAGRAAPRRRGARRGARRGRPPGSGPGCPERGDRRFRRVRRRPSAVDRRAGRLGWSADVARRRRVRPAAVPLRPARRVAAARRGGARGGIVDLSDRHPGDPVPEVVARALADAGARRRPATRRRSGAPALREAAAGWMERRFGVSVDPAQVDRAASGPRSWSPRSPTCSTCATRRRDTVLYPAVVLPDLRDGRELAGLPGRPRPARRRAGTSTSRRCAEEDAARALLLWLNEPGQPHRRSRAPPTPVAAAVGWARRGASIVASDECYVEFTWDAAATRPGPPPWRAGTDGVLAVHSLSKRSNMAGCRCGFVRRRRRPRRLPRSRSASTPG